ncbi:hypothetical protein D0Z00_001210 [Geotrichum galactomycetum]|uniref:Uncharacterized protein n=1 Tax=Geotrichum galactomycetum TaxID=27317 RepID=A0ACB6V7N5_9ASCO|nr:hypothetical protein D0Z00_001210 [Geotrichum candidum]
MSNVTSWSATPPPTYSELKPPLLSFISDETLSLALPIVVYWIMGLFFQYLNDRDMFPQYRLHTPEELEKRNKCSLAEVVRAVFFQHILQTIAGLVLAFIDEPQKTGFEALEMWNIQNFVANMTGGTVRLSKSSVWIIYYILEPGLRILFAFLFIDTWQFFLHRYMHMNKFLYRHLHSVHHRLYVPYAFGALYNSILEGFLLDTLGTGVAHLLTGLSAREAIILYTFSTMKTVDDHCGYALPWDPFQVLFPNNATYHDIHHQHFGIKTNFSQPFFIFWDKLFNTEYQNMKEYVAKQTLIREEKYQELLKQRELAKEKKDQ